MGKSLLNLDGRGHGAFACNCAIIAVLAAVAWLVLNVTFNYGGSLTGLFYTGAGAALLTARSDRWVD